MLGKGGRHRTLLLDDPTLLRLLRRYLRETRYRHGPLFRAGPYRSQLLLRRVRFESPPAVRPSAKVS